MLLEINSLTKLYDPNNGVKDFNLSVDKGEFITLLGPSGCGKTTTLNLLGGFLKPDSGEIIMEGYPITHLPPEKRPLSTVFQSYALFPHMNVIENIAYGIQYYRKSKRKIALEMACEFVEIVGLEGYEKSRIDHLSGGQQQRVALARAMATNPKLLILDEPLSNLDASLRSRLRDELKALQNKIGMTMIFVTHDQSEALSLSDRIVVMDKGSIAQVGTPREIYLSPQTEYVANFVGKTNTLVDSTGKKKFVRPEDIQIELNENGLFEIKSIIFFGHYTEIKISDGEQIFEVTIFGRNSCKYVLGQKVDVSGI